MMRIFDRTRRTRLLLAVLLSASIALVTIDFRTHGNGPLEAVGRALMTVIGPVQQAVTRTLRPVGNFFAGFSQVPSLKAEIAKLQQDNAALQQRELQVADIERENEELRGLLGISRRFDLQTVAVRVTGVGPSNFENTVFVDRGSTDGVRRDMPVIGGAGLVGRVVSTSPHTARVLLMIDPSSAVAAKLAENGQTGIVSGEGGEQVRFDLFGADAAVTLGDEVVTSGYRGGVYPPGIPIGTVARLEPKGSSLTRRAWVQPYVDFTSLDFLLIVTGTGAVR